MERKHLIKEFHILLCRCGIDENGKHAILGAYGVESSTELNDSQLAEVNNKLKAELQKAGKEPKPKSSPLDLARRQVKVAIGRYLAAKGEIPASGWLLPEWNKITGVACRAAQSGSFNQIPLSKLRGIVYEFNKQREAMENARIFITNGTN